MRNMSFALTTPQVRAKTKTVTRRLGWKNLKPGTLLQPVVNGMGLKKGERVETIGGPIRIVRVRRERLFVRGFDGHDARYGRMEAAREGFLHHTSYGEFVDFYIAHNGGPRSQTVTRIEFEYVEEQ
jgi:hypothetical protein